MSTLDSLIRLHRWQLDEQRRAVAELEQLGTKLSGDLQRLEAEQAAEEAAARHAPSINYGYGSYIAALIERRRKLSQSLAEAEQRIAKARDALGEAFQEAKRYEIAAAKRVLNQRMQADRLQQHEMDELGADIHRRRMKREG